MALKFKKVKADSSNYGSSRSTSTIKYIVIHYTGNKGDTALNNCKYFQGKNRKASAHYFVDGGTYIYESVPPTITAWSVGGCYSTSGSAGSFYKKCTNANSVSIEMCNSVKSVPDATYKQAVALTKYLMDKYDIPAANVIRHWDVNGKECPLPWIGASSKGWKQFKSDITDKEFAAGDYNANVITTKKCPVRIGRGKNYEQIGTLKTGTTVKALYIAESDAGNLWASIDYGNSVGYICLNNCKPK
jgi:N-acetylmuramoyl-L-alanine amidase CwlA